MKYLTLNSTSSFISFLLMLFIVKTWRFLCSAIASQFASNRTQLRREIVKCFYFALRSMASLKRGAPPALHENRKWRNWWRLTPARMYFNMKFKVVVGFARYILPYSGLYIKRALVLKTNGERARRVNEGGALLVETHQDASQLCACWRKHWKPKRLLIRGRRKQF